MERFRELLETMMRTREWSLSRLGREAEIQPSIISRWLNAPSSAPTSKPSPRNLAKLAPVLGVPYEELMRMCGYLPSSTEAEPQHDPVRAELDARLSQLGTTLSRYPRAFWLAVVEGAERMTRAGDALLEPPVNAVRQGGVSESSHRLTPRKAGRRGQLPTRYPGVSLALSLAR